MEAINNFGMEKNRKDHRSEGGKRRHFRGMSEKLM